MGRQDLEDEQEMLLGQAKIWQYIFGFLDGIALKCVVQLGIPDIINSHGRPLSFSSIVKTINQPSLDADRLSRVMTLLVRRGIFTATSSEEEDGVHATLYGLTNASKWLIRDSEMSLAPMLLLQHHREWQSAWQNLPDIVKNGDSGFTSKSHGGSSLWDFASANSEFNTIFNQAMAVTSKLVVKAFMKTYKDELNGIGSLVDVAGGTGTLVSEIVKAHPHIKGINFDLPHVIAEAPEHAGVTHVSGDMFTGIPPADAIILKWILHNWSDEDCIKILKNCQKALPEKAGRLIIIDAVLLPEGDNLFDELALIGDMAMMVHLNAQERNEAEWKKLLEEAGFTSYKIIKMPDQASIIEAYVN
ncbi:hypothetical protein JCGZ_24526 [Jatropha curcas]|uniref:O-methyltransferase domain-containing protein n=1 Tax=Jatropha curcas TaxID=180498 RepID=A0A067KWJ0_JATCU|nr:(R,S)-reticuline 7-O-methyltransferase [Jatropha curcas]KDP40527.1 hypothetical protein JCGZ_24526 [Jatropha curcas]